MSILEKAKNFFIREKIIEKEIVREVPAKIKADNPGRLIAPLWREIPPEFSTVNLQQVASWTFIAVSAIADEVSTTELRLFDRKGNEVENHPALNLIKKPNSLQGKTEFFWIGMIYYLIEGELPLFLDNPKNPQTMLMLQPDRLTVNFDKEKIVSSYRYMRSDGTFEIIPAEQIIFLKIPSFLTPFRGKGISSYIVKTINLDRFLEDYANIFFYNSAVPSVTLETDEVLDDAVAKRLRAQFESRHKGVRNSHRAAILEQGLKLNKFGFNLSELMMDKMDDKTRDKILAAFKVPKSIVGIIEDVNRASAQTSDYVFARRAVKPRLMMLENQLNEFFLPMFSNSEGYKFKFDDPVSKDVELDAKIHDIYLKDQVLTVNEVREEIGYGEIEGGDKPPKQPEPPTAEPQADDPPADEPPKKSKSKKNFESVLKDIVLGELRKKIKKEYTPEELNKYWETKTIFTDRIEQEYNQKLASYWRTVKANVLFSLKNRKKLEMKELIQSGMAEVSFDPETEAKVFAKISIPFFTDTIVHQSKITMNLIGLSGGLSDRDKLVKDNVQKQADKAAKSVTGTTKMQLERVLSDWAKMEEGNLADLHGMLKDYFDRTEITRVENIARTEISRSAGWATLQTYKEVGGIEAKKWLTAEDERVCPFCKKMDGKTIPLNDSFFKKGDELKAGDKTLNIDYASVKSYPLHNGCRCDLIPIFEK